MKGAYPGPGFSPAQIERVYSTDAGRGTSVRPTVGSGLLAMAVLVWWLGRPGAAGALAASGLTLAVAGFALPTRLGPIEQVYSRSSLGISEGADRHE